MYAKNDSSIHGDVDTDEGLRSVGSRDETSTVKGGATAQSNPYEQLKESIYLGRLLPGQQLIETSLAAMFNVSRTPVREALARLEHDGLVQRDHTGLTVRQRSPGEILDIYEVRITLEGFAARVAAERRTNNDLLDLRRAMKRYAAVTKGDLEAMVSANHHFHKGVWAAAHQPELADILQRTELQLGRFPVTTLSYGERWEQSLEQHEAIVSAIEDRDSDRAEHVCTEHFRTARDIRLELWENDFESDT